MIGISAPVFDPHGSVIINEDSDSVLGDNTARVSRTKTLDGGVYINHSGVSQGDRTLIVRAKISRDQGRVIQHIFKSYKMVEVSTRVGLFEAVIATCNINHGELYMKILVNKKLDEE